MDGIAVHIAAALVLIGAGCAVTIVSAYALPLSVRLRAQEHGRFAGLCASPGHDPTGRHSGPQGPALQNPVPVEQI
jgi:hypothetical protein